MNVYSILGLLMGAVVIYFGLHFSAGDKGILLFYDKISIFIVLGGTLAATSISIQLDRVWALFKIFLERMIRGKKFDYQVVIKEMMEVGEAYRTGKHMKELVPKVRDPFLKEGLQMHLDEILDEKQLIKILLDRTENVYYAHMSEASKMKSIGKYPPAFGMMGTTIGMIVLLGGLGGKDALKTMGPAMGICLITTLYGTILANLAVVPIGENLIESAKENYLKNKIVVEGIKLILKKTNPVVLAEELNSFLLPHQRLDWKKALNRA